MRVLQVVGAWLVAGAATLLFATTSALGPTVTVMGSRRGAQAGDLVFALVVAGGAALVTRRVWPLSGTEVRVLLAGASWVAAGAVSLLMASTTSVGPEVMELSAEHGVHSGDIAFTLVCAGGAALVTHALLTKGRNPALSGDDRRR